LRGPDPLLGQAEVVGSPAFPGARRRHAHEVDPQAHAACALLADELVDLLSMQRGCAGQALGDEHRRVRHRRLLQRSAQRAQPERAPRLARSCRWRETAATIPGRSGQETSSRPNVRRAAAPGHGRDSIPAYAKIAA